MPEELTAAQRALAVLDLLQRRVSWTAGELAAELGVTERTVRRDMARLRDIGYPVEATHGASGGYRLGTGMRLPPLLIDGDEAVTISVALRLVAGAAVSGVGERAVRVMAKLDQLMPGPHREKVASLSESIVAVVGEQSVDPEDLVELANAIRDSRQVTFTYCDRRGRESDRRCEPYGIVVLERRWYLVAYDLMRTDWRTFRLDRMAALEASTFAFTPREDAPDPTEHVKKSVTHDQYPVHGSAVIAASAAHIRRIVPESMVPLRVLRDPGHPDGPACEVTIRGHSREGAAWYVAGFRAPVESVEPPDLAAAVGDLGRRLAGF